MSRRLRAGLLRAFSPFALVGFRLPDAGADAAFFAAMPLLRYASTLPPPFIFRATMSLPPLLRRRLPPLHFARPRAC